MSVGERRKEKREREKGKKSLLSKIYGNRIVGFRRSKRQSRSTHRELRVDTKLHKVGNFPTLNIFILKAM